MDLYRIIDELHEERNRIDKIIRSLELTETRDGRGRDGRRRGPGRRFMDADGRKDVSERMKRYWAARRSEKASAGVAASVNGNNEGRSAAPMSNAADD